VLVTVGVVVIWAAPALVATNPQPTSLGRAVASPIRGLPIPEYAEPGVSDDVARWKYRRRSYDVGLSITPAHIRHWYLRRDIPMQAWRTDWTWCRQIGPDAEPGSTSEYLWRDTHRQRILALSISRNYDDLADLNGNRGHAIIDIAEYPDGPLAHENPRC
jgi:hypothetical protein